MKNQKHKIQSTFLAIAIIATGLSLQAQNTNYGYEAGRGGDYNSCFGYFAGDSVEGSYNTFIGANNGKENSSGHHNAFLGSHTGITNTTGNYNTFIGADAGFNNNASENTFLGCRSGYDNTTGTRNSFLGTYAGENITSGGNNTIVGCRSGYRSTTGNGNSYFGTEAGFSSTTAGYNTLIGMYSGYSIRTGAFNSSLGYSSGRGNTTGSRNTNLGSFSGYTNTSGIGNVFVGYGAGYYEKGSNKLYITNDLDTTPLIYGDFSTDQVTINGFLFIIGKASASEIEVKLMSSNAIISDNIKTESLNVAIDKVADYVFEDSYELRPLAEVEGFVMKNKHLPGIPSGNELKEKGMDVAEMNNLLLEKIEELTLYLIEQDKRIKELENQK